MRLKNDLYKEMSLLISISGIKSFHKLSFQNIPENFFWKETVCSPVEVIDVSEDRTASIFSVEE
jgi:hypothetical protein